MWYSSSDCGTIALWFPPNGSGHHPPPGFWAFGCRPSLVGRRNRSLKMHRQSSISWGLSRRNSGGQSSRAKYGARQLSPRARAPCLVPLCRYTRVGNRPSLAPMRRAVSYTVNSPTPKIEPIVALTRHHPAARATVLRPLPRGPREAPGVDDRTAGHTGFAPNPPVLPPNQPSVPLRNWPTRLGLWDDEPPRTPARSRPNSHFH